MGVLLIGLRKRLRRLELAAELPEIIRLVHLRVVNDHLRSRPREVGLTRSVVFKMGGEGTAGLHGGSESGNRSVLCFLYLFFQMIKDHYFSKLARNDPLHDPVAFHGLCRIPPPSEGRGLLRRSC